MLNKRIFKTMIFAMGTLVPAAYGVNYLRKNKEKNAKKIEEIRQETKALVVRANILYKHIEDEHGDFCEMWPTQEFVNVCLLRGKFKSNVDRGYYYSYAQNLQASIEKQYSKLLSDVTSYEDYICKILDFDNCTKEDNDTINKKLGTFRTRLNDIIASISELEQVWTPLNANDANAIEGMLEYMREKESKEAYKKRQDNWRAEQEKEKEFELNKLKLENEKTKLANETEKYVADKKLQTVSNLGLNAACMFKNMFKSTKKDDE